MDDPNYQGMSAARRHAEAMIRETLERRPKGEQERNREALAAKTARLRELRLAKEAAEKRPKAKAVRQQKRKPRRINCY